MGCGLNQLKFLQYTWWPEFGFFSENSTIESAMMYYKHLSERGPGREPTFLVCICGCKFVLQSV